MSELGKCQFDAAGMLQTCNAMKRYVKESGDGQKGLFRVQTLTDRNFRDMGIRMKNGFSDCGLMLNSCPWCLGDIRSWANELERKQESK